MASQKLWLTVEKLGTDDVYQDRVRLHRDIRGDIRVGQICRLSTSKGSAYVEARPKTGDGDLTIKMDRVLRKRLNVAIGEKVEVTITKAGLYGQTVWAVMATDPRVFVPARLGLLSAALGLLSVVLSVIPFVHWGSHAP